MSAIQQAEQELALLGPLPFPIPLGRLAPAVEALFQAWPKGEWILAGPRERVGAILRGCPAARLVDPAQGARPYKLAPVGSRPASRALHAVGLALGAGAPVMCLLGAAGAASGDLHEAFNLAVLTGAPVVFVYLDPPVSADAPLARQLAPAIEELAAAFGIEAALLPLDAGSSQIGEALLAARGRASQAPQLLRLTLS